MARVVYGSALPPELAWNRTFETLLDHCSISEVPRCVCLQTVEPDVIPMRPWALAFVDVAWVSKLIPLELDNVAAPSLALPAPRLVAHALFPTISVEANSSQVSPEVSEESFSFSMKKVAKRKVAPLVDTSLRRCTRGSVRRDDYKQVLHALPMSEPHKKKPKEKLLRPRLYRPERGEWEIQNLFGKF